MQKKRNTNLYFYHGKIFIVIDSEIVCILFSSIFPSFHWKYRQKAVLLSFVNILLSMGQRVARNSFPSENYCFALRMCLLKLLHLIFSKDMIPTASSIRCTCLNARHFRRISHVQTLVTEDPFFINIESPCTSTTV